MPLLLLVRLVLLLLLLLPPLLLLSAPRLVKKVAEAAEASVATWSNFPGLELELELELEVELGLRLKPRLSETASVSWFPP